MRSVSSTELPHRSALKRFGLIGVITLGLAVGCASNDPTVSASAPEDPVTEALRPAVSIPPAGPRLAAGEIKGATELLDRARGSLGSWTSVSGEFDGGGAAALPFTIAEDLTYHISIGEGAEGRRADGTVFQYVPELGKLLVQQGLPASREDGQPSGSSAELGDAAIRLPAEAPTRIDTLNLMLAPSYWIRATVEPNATEIRRIGSESIGGRKVTRFQILFGGPAAEKYGKDGWTWWLDDELGILLQYEITFADPSIPNQRAALKDLSFDSVKTVDVELPTVPAGTTVEALVVEKGSTKPVALVTEAPMSVDQAVAEAKLRPAVDLGSTPGS